MVTTRTLKTSAAIVLGAVLAVGVVRGDERAKERPAPAGPRPLLKQLNAEVQSLYHEVQAGVCRVQLPPPRWAGAPQMERWAQRVRLWLQDFF